MKKTFFFFVLASASVLFSSNSPAQSAPQDDRPYRAVGEKAGLVLLMDDFMTRLLADARTSPHFKPANQLPIKEQLVEQFCALSGGPCVYKGADMKTSHAELEINKSDFHALVEVLQLGIDARGIAFGKQGQMLPLLAPMCRDIITVP